MAGVKTVDLLLGVVLVLQCVGNARAEITASNGKKLLFFTFFSADLFDTLTYFMQEKHPTGCVQAQIASTPLFIQHI